MHSAAKCCEKVCRFHRSQRFLLLTFIRPCSSGGLATLFLKNCRWKALTGWDALNTLTPLNHSIDIHCQVTYFSTIKFGAHCWQICRFFSRLIDSFLACEMSENGEKWLFVFPKAQDDVLKWVSLKTWNFSWIEGFAGCSSTIQMFSARKGVRWYIK